MQIYRLYDWSGLTPADKVVTGTLISPSENNAVSQLISRSITPVSLFCRKRLVCSQKENSICCTLPAAGNITDVGITVTESAHTTGR